AWLASAASGLAHPFSRLAALDVLERTGCPFGGVDISTRCVRRAAAFRAHGAAFASHVGCAAADSVGRTLPATAARIAALLCTRRPRTLSRLASAPGIRPDPDTSGRRLAGDDRKPLCVARTCGL